MVQCFTPLPSNILQLAQFSCMVMQHYNVLMQFCLVHLHLGHCTTQCNMSLLDTYNTFIMPLHLLSHLPFKSIHSFASSSMNDFILPLISEKAWKSLPSLSSSLNPLLHCILQQSAMLQCRMWMPPIVLLTLAQMLTCTFCLLIY